MATINKVENQDVVVETTQQVRFDPKTRQSVSVDVATAYTKDQITNNIAIAQATQSRWQAMLDLLNKE